VKKKTEGSGVLQDDRRINENLKTRKRRDGKEKKEIIKTQD
jgi:hypothetical protein